MCCLMKSLCVSFNSEKVPIHIIFLGVFRWSEAFHWTMFKFFMQYKDQFNGNEWLLHYYKISWWGKTLPRRVQTTKTDLRDVLVPSNFMIVHMQFSLIKQHFNSFVHQNRIIFHFHLCNKSSVKHYNGKDDFSWK